MQFICILRGHDFKDVNIGSCKRTNNSQLKRRWKKLWCKKWFLNGNAFIQRGFSLTVYNFNLFCYFTCGKDNISRHKFVVHDGELWELDTCHTSNCVFSSLPVKLDVICCVSIYRKNINQICRGVKYKLLDQSKYQITYHVLVRDLLSLIYYIMLLCYVIFLYITL